MLPRLWSKGDSDVCRESEAVSPQFESRRRMRHFHRDECKGEAGEAARRWTSAEVPRAAGASAEPGERTAAAESMCPSPGGGQAASASSTPRDDTGGPQRAAQEKGQHRAVTLGGQRSQAPTASSERCLPALLPAQPAGGSKAVLAVRRGVGVTGAGWGEGSQRHRVSCARVRAHARTCTHMYTYIYTRGTTGQIRDGPTVIILSRLGG